MRAGGSVTFELLAASHDARDHLLADYVYQFEIHIAIFYDLAPFIRQATSLLGRQGFSQIEVLLS